MNGLGVFVYHWSGCLVYIYIYLQLQFGFCMHVYSSSFEVLFRVLTPRRIDGMHDLHTSLIRAISPPFRVSFIFHMLGERSCIA